MGLLDSITNILDGGAGKKALNAAKEGVANYEELKKILPTFDQTQVDYEDFQSAGELNPFLENQINLSDTDLNNISQEGVGRDAQIRALQAISAKVDAGGLTDADKADLNNIINQSQIVNKGNQERIIQNAQERGVGGSGVEMANRLISQQTSANDLNTRGLEINKQAEAAKQAALQNLLTGGTTVRSADYNQQAEKAKAQDEINRFNTNNQVGQQQRNIQQQNVAQTGNLNNRQDIANKNTVLKNQETSNAADFAGENFDRNLQIASGKTGANNQVVNQYNTRAAANAKLSGDLISLGKQGATAAFPETMAMFSKPETAAAGSYFFSDENCKTDMKEFDPSDFLDSIVPTKFKYKKDTPNTDQKQNYGVIAQDLEKTPEGKSLVYDTPEGKMVDGKKAIPLIMAALAELNNKIEGK